MSAHDAAALPLAGLTALQALRDLGQVAAGKHVLVFGASGGVGHFAAQIVKSYEAHVTAVCSGPHIDMVRGLGADHVIDYTKQSDFRSMQPYDIVLDSVVQQPVRVLLPTPHKYPSQSIEVHKPIVNTGIFIALRLS